MLYAFRIQYAMLCHAMPRRSSNTVFVAINAACPPRPAQLSGTWAPLAVALGLCLSTQYILSD